MTGRTVLGTGQAPALSGGGATNIGLLEDVWTVFVVRMFAECAEVI
jgi:hypothetical protein